MSDKTPVFRPFVRLRRCIRPADLFGLAAFLACLWLGCVAAQAHKVSVFAWVEGGKVHVESKFSGGRRPKGTPIHVYDSQGRKLLEGTTDDNGAFVFDVPAITDLKIVLLAGMGHRAEWIVPKSEIEPLAGGTPERPGPATPSNMAPRVDQAAEPTQELPKPRSVAPLSAAEMETIVERVVETKLAPIRQMLAEYPHTGPSLTDVIGGIGYILGLVGLATYIGYRKKK